MNKQNFARGFAACSMTLAVAVGVVASCEDRETEAPPAKSPQASKSLLEDVPKYNLEESAMKMVWGQLNLEDKQVMCSALSLLGKDFLAGELARAKSDKNSGDVDWNKVAGQIEKECRKEGL